VRQCRYSVPVSLIGRRLQVTIEARRAAGDQLAPVIPIGTPHCDERPQPDLAAYDGLLGHGEVSQ